MSIDQSPAVGEETTAAPEIDESFRPRLRHCTFFRPETGPVLMIVGDQHFEIEQVGSDFDSFLNLKRYLDGRHTISEISDITGVSVPDVRGIVDSFVAGGLIRPSATAAETIPVPEFMEQIDRSTGMWIEQIGYHPIWPALENRRYRPEVFLGLILETYHYINSASRHISTAIAHCQDPHWKHLLSEYLTEEYDHAWMVRDSLMNMGLPKEQIENAHPVIGTWSLINNLCEIARTDTLGYLACTKLFEARGAETLDGAHTLQRLAEDYGFPAGCLAPLVSHVEIDVAANHTGLLEEAMEGHEVVLTRDAHRAVNNLHDLKHSYDQYYYGIIGYYRDISNYIPRLTVDYNSL